MADNKREKGTLETEFGDFRVLLWPAWPSNFKRKKEKKLTSDDGDAVTTLGDSGSKRTRQVVVKVLVQAVEVKDGIDDILQADELGLDAAVL